MKITITLLFKTHLENFLDEPGDFRKLVLN